MKIKKLYALLNTETRELVPAYLYRQNRYAWCSEGRVRSRFKLLIEDYPTKYKVVELRPIPLLGEQ